MKLEKAEAATAEVSRSSQVISEDEYNQWLREYRAAESSFLDREEKLKRTFRKIERDLSLLGKLLRHRCASCVG